MRGFSKRIIWLSSIIFFIFVVDRVSKWLALHILPREGVFVILKVTGFILERNQGIAYSIPLSPSLLIVLVSIIIILLTAFLVRAYRQKELDVMAAFSLIIVGAISNFIDRLRYEYVIDMIVLTSWPVFNLADLMIMAGTAWLIIKVIRKRKTNS